MRKHHTRVHPTLTPSRSQNTQVFSGEWASKEDAGYVELEIFVEHPQRYFTDSKMKNSNLGEMIKLKIKILERNI